MESFEISCSETEFVDAFRSTGFLSPYIEEAVPGYVSQNQTWFDHAELLNRVGLAAYYRRDHTFVGLTSHDPVALAVRMIFRALSAAQGAIILYKRGMIAEGDTLSRNIYETAFWLGFIRAEPDEAVSAILADERKSQLDRANYYVERLRKGELDIDRETEADLHDRIRELKDALGKVKSLSPKEVARRAGMFPMYDAYKHLSASSAHNSLNSLHRYLLRNEDGSYDGLQVGPDLDGLSEALPILCVAIGCAIAHFGTFVPIEEDEEELQAALIRTDALRFEQKASGGGIATIV